MGIGISTVRVCAIALGFASALAAAAPPPEPGVTDSSILIGQSAGLTGPLSGATKEQIAGAQVYFDSINKKGGINGRKITLKTVDDGSDAKRTPDVVNHLLQDDHVFALFMTTGIPENDALLPVVTKEGVPLVSPQSGSMALNRPVNHWVFNVRAKYQDEVARAINHLVTTNLTHIALFYTSDSFGIDAREGFEQALKGRKMQPTLIVSFHPGKDIKGGTDALFVAHPQAIIVVGPLEETTKFIKEFKKRIPDEVFVTLSNNAVRPFITGLGDEGRGIIITEIAPGSSDNGMSVVKEYDDTAKSLGVEPSEGGVEGFISAKVLVEGLRRAGKSLTREHLVDSLETLRNFDIGGIPISFSPQSHSGSQFVETAIISQNGKLVR